MKEILTAKGQRILVDDEDFEAMSKFAWRVTDKGYVQRAKIVNGKRTHTLMHRQILGLAADDPRIVDHANGVKTDNRRCNLRICTKVENGYNRGVARHSTSGLKAVSRSSDGEAWRAQIRSNGKKIHLGTFSTAEQAHAAYAEAAKTLHGEFANIGEQL